MAENVNLASSRRECTFFTVMSMVVAETVALLFVSALRDVSKRLWKIKASNLSEANIRCLEYQVQGQPNSNAKIVLAEPKFCTHASQLTSMPFPAFTCENTEHSPGAITAELTQVQAVGGQLMHIQRSPYYQSHDIPFTSKVLHTHGHKLLALASAHDGVGSHSLHSMEADLLTVANTRHVLARRNREYEEKRLSEARLLVDQGYHALRKAMTHEELLAGKETALVTQREMGQWGPSPGSDR
jgi:hypothetical protein